MPFRPCEETQHSRKRQCKYEQDTHADPIDPPIGVFEVVDEMVQQIDWYHQEKQHHEGNDPVGEVVDALAGVVYLIAGRFLLCLL